MGHDLIIRSGTIVDGSGGARYRADVGVRDGKITEIGKISSRGSQEIDAEGHVVSPGFIDGHTHYDAQVNWDPLGTSSCWHGVTSVVMGNCGFTLAPSRSTGRELVVRNLERAEDISAKAMALGINWNWETFPEYLDALETLPKGINYSVFVGHSALRTWAMGERAFEGEASEDDMARMRAQLKDAVKAGAMGLSTSRNTGHETADNRPVASRFASWDEIRALVGTMGEAGTGIFEIANDVTTRIMDPQARKRSLGLLRDLAVETKVPLTFSVIRLATEKPTDTSFRLHTPREIWRDFLDLFDATAAAGGTIFGLASSRDVNVLLSFKTQLPFDRLPVWKEFRAKPLAEQAELLRDPETKAKLIKVANTAAYGRAIGQEARPPNWDTMHVFDKPLPPYPRMAELAKQRGIDPVSLMIDLSLEREFNCFFMQFPTMADDDGLLEIMKHPRTIMTFSDAGAHVGQISDCSIQTHLLSWWVRERQALSLEQAIHSMTGRSAKCWGFADRGLIREGMVADINVFDPKRVTARLPEVVYDLPGGARRMIQRSDGFKATIVGGKTVLLNGEHTGALPGRLLRSKKAA